MSIPIAKKVLYFFWLMYGQDLLKMHKRILKQALSLSLYIHTYIYICTVKRQCFFIVEIIIPSLQSFSFFGDKRSLCSTSPCLVASCLGAKEAQTRASSYHWDECGRVASCQMSSNCQVTVEKGRVELWAWQYIEDLFLYI